MFETIRRAVRTIFPNIIPKKKGIMEGKFPFALTVYMSAEMKRHCRKMSDTYGSMSNFVRMVIHSHMKGGAGGSQPSIPTKTLTIERYTLEEPVIPKEPVIPQEEETEQLSPPVELGYGPDHGKLMEEIRRTKRFKELHD